MIIHVITEAEIAGSVWPAGTRLECPDRAAKKAIAEGLASLAAPKAAPKAAPANDEPDPEERPRRGRPKRS